MFNRKLAQKLGRVHLFEVRGAETDDDARTCDIVYGDFRCQAMRGLRHRSACRGYEKNTVWCVERNLLEARLAEPGLGHATWW